MNNQDKKKYLKSYNELNCSIDQKLDELANLRSLATKVTTTLSDMPKGSKTSDKSDTYIKLIMLEDEINKDIDRYVDFRHDIENSIMMLDDIILQNVLRLKYINNLTWEQVAVEMKCSYYYVVKELHSKALTKFKTPQTTPR